MDERRQLPRWEVKKEVKVWMPQTQDFSHGILEDINLKGMCLSFSKRIPDENPLRMSFAIAEDMIKIEAQVPWAKQEDGRYVYGLLFNKIAEDDKDKIYQYITDNCYDQFKNKWWGS